MTEVPVLGGRERGEPSPAPAAGKLLDELRVMNIRFHLAVVIGSLPPTTPTVKEVPRSPGYSGLPERNSVARTPRL
jgi:hypothetical protein